MNLRAATESIILALKNGTTLDINEYQANSRAVMQNKTVQEKVMHTDTQKLINQFPDKQKRVISRKLDFK